jgi:hypothetical protein
MFPNPRMRMKYTGACTLAEAVTVIIPVVAFQLNVTV